MEILVFGANATLPLVACTVIGLILRTRGMIDDEFIKKLNKIVFSVFIQCLIFKNIYSVDYESQASITFILFAACCILVIVILSIIVSRILVKDRVKAACYAQIALRSNYLMYGTAVLRNMYGDAGAEVGALLIPVSIILFNSSTIMLFSSIRMEQDQSMGKVLAKSLGNILKSPIFFSSAAGIILGLLRVPLPVWVNTTVTSIAGAATPLCLLMMGAQINWESLRSDFRKVLMMSSIRLIAVPAVAVAAALLMGFRGMQLAALFVLFGSPSANIGLVMANEYGIEPAFTAQTLALTTMASSLTIFIGITTMRFFGLL